MKAFTSLLVPAVALVLTAASATGNGGNPSGPPVQLWTIWDTSHSNRSVWKEERALASAAVGALMTGDRIRLVSAGHDRPRLLLLERVSEEGSRERIQAALDDVEAGMHRADLSRALDVVLSAAQAEDKRLPAGTAVMVLTDACLGSRESVELVQAVKGLEDKGATVLVTGIGEAAREILIAVARGELHWQLLSECDPPKWIAGIRSDLSRDRELPAPSPEQASPLGVGRATTGASPPEKADTASTTKKEEDLASHKEKGPLSGGDGHTSLAPQPGAADMVEEREKLLARGISLGRKEDAPEAATLKPLSLELRTELRDGEPPSAGGAGPAQGGHGHVEAEAALTRPAPAAPSLARAQEIPPSKDARKGGSRLFWSALAATGILGLIVTGLLAPDALKVLRRRVRWNRGGDASGHGKPCQLIAEVGRVEQVLGRADRLRRFHAGSGAENALCVQGEGVERRHLEFFRWGGWWLKNLSRQPVEVNGRALPGRKKERINFPASIRIGRETRIRLFVRPLRPSEGKAGGGSGDLKEGTQDETST